jgi:hypothetical protein
MPETMRLVRLDVLSGLARIYTYPDGHREIRLLTLTAGVASAEGVSVKQWELLSADGPAVPTR